MASYISKEFVRQFVEDNIHKFNTVDASFFEINTVMAFEYFKQKKVDYAVIETGMGGRLDSTNIITPLLSVITNISYDHQQFLGDTLRKIAGEKAGIIKPGVPVVIGETSKETKAVFAKKAKSTNSEIHFADKEISSADYSTDIKGPYQSKNIITALMAVEVLKKQGIKISHKAIRQGLKHVAKNTSFIGRWMVMNKKPIIIFDSAHNEGGLRELIAGINEEKYKTLHFILGTVSDKDISKILSLLPKTAQYYFCKANIPRGLDAEQLKTQAALFRLKGETFPSVKAAFKAAKSRAGKKDMIVVSGSVFVVAEVL